ncbi:MAG: GAF domain-containing protein [Anaerolineales bacterium]|uniref:GAF domain-containing protein n=1 Tax=Candidatus Desulfolinea nitratireducens TaxID=2841698 RepID=A0A8J6TK73_9CHLR|nr:GAF domain-containing protein [Candidatus Desulfolinea nitratireducens]
MRNFPAKYSSLDDIRTFVAKRAIKAGLTDKAIYAVQLAVDEACTNIIDHAYRGESDQQIEINCEITKDNLIIRLQDNGRSFDMDSVSTPDLNLPLIERQVGGLGVHLIRNLMDGINYQATHDQGNILTLTKNRDVSRHLISSDWTKLSNLGEQMLNTKSLASQRDSIQQMVARLIDGDVDVWLDESLFRLPDWDEEPIFPESPSTDAAKQAFKSGRPIQVKENGRAVVAFPLEDQNFIMGTMQINRSADKPFSQGELDTLEGIASIAALNLVTGHRVAVENWRIGQLSLVRQVSTQIANVMDIDELAKRVTSLIQATFHYYYVALFTIDPRKDILHFRSGARAPRKGRKKATPKLEIKLGQGLIGNVAKNGEEMVCPDVMAEPLYRFLSGLPETKSEIVLPLKTEDRILGVLDVQSDRLNAFHPNDLLVLRALADNIAIAIEGARLYSALRRRADQLDVVAEVSRKATSTLSLSKLMADVALLITERFGYSHVHLFTVHQNRRRIHYEAGSGKRTENLGENYGLDLDDPEGLIPWVARNRQSVLANDVSKEPRYRMSPLPPENTKAELVVPLVFDEKIMGVLDVQSDHINSFSDEDLLLFEALGGNVAAAIHNADLYRSEQWRRQVADSLREVAGLLSDNVNVEQVLDAILTELERTLPTEISTLWLLRDEGELYLAAVHGIEKSVLEDIRRSSADASISLASALLSSKPVIRNAEDVMGPVGLAAGFESNYSSIAAPLHIGDQPIGVLTLSHHTSGRYGHEAQAITSTFASYAAVAIENARLYDSAQEQAYASAALLQVAQAVASMAELDEILDSIIRIMPILVGVERCAIYIWDEATQQYTSAQAYGLSDEDEFLVWQDIYSPGEFPLLDGVRSANTMLLRLFTETCCWLDISSPWGDGFDEYLKCDDDLLMAVPLIIKDDLFGVLLAEEAPGGRRFRSRRLEIIAGIAQQAALAIQNDRLQEEMVVRERLEHEVQVAREIQKTFIPDRLPEPSGWELAGRWQTARQVGGDFYDVIELPDQHLGLFIADVADKGIPAALFMALTRTLVRAAILDNPSPARALRRVNDLLIPDTNQGMFVTAFYGVLSLKTGLLTYANAGHNPPFWLQKKTNQIVRLTRTGMALGVIEGTEMDQRDIQLLPKDSLLLYTDGLTEAFSPDGDLFGEDRLKAALSTPGNIAIQDMLDNIEKELDVFMSTLPPADDLSMLAIRRLA